MKEYENYIKEIKGICPEMDDNRMYSGVNARISRRTRTINFTLSATLILLLGFTAYLGSYLYYFNGQISLSDYVFQQRDNGNDSIMNYVYVD